MAGVRRNEQDGTVTFQWGSDGDAFEFPAGDEELGTQAFRKAVAQGLARGDTSVMSEIERYVAREIGSAVSVRKDAADSLWVAWFPDADTADTLSKLYTGEGAVPVANLHCTLLYLGDPDVDKSGPWNVDLLAAATCLFANQYGSVDATVAGIGRFVGEGDTDVIVALLDAPHLAQLRHSLKESLGYAGALPYNSPAYSEKHGFVPHVTLAYVPKDSPTPNGIETQDVCIDNLTVCVGVQRATYPLASYNGPEDATAAFTAAREIIEKAGRVISAGSPEARQTAQVALSKAITVEAKRLKKETSTTNSGTESAASAQGTEGEEATYAITKAVEEMRYTLGPLYSPNRKDAHGEWVEPDTLHKAAIAFMQERFDAGDNRLNLQHGDLGEHQVGNIVECMAWPYDHTIMLKQADGTEVEQEMPAGTVYMGIVWDEDTWPLVKNGRIGGLSMGGRAVRVKEGDASAFEHMGHKYSKAGPHKFTAKDGGTKCTVCGETEAGGVHYSGESAPTKKTVAQHPFVDRGDGTCAECGATEADGSHGPVEPADSSGSDGQGFGDTDGDVSTARRALALVKEAKAEHDHDLEVIRLAAEENDRVHKAEVDGLRAERADERGHVVKVVDLLTRQAQPELHVHLPEQNVNINEAPLEDGG